MNINQNIGNEIVFYILVLIKINHKLLYLNLIDKYYISHHIDYILIYHLP